jgi:hypothetical protein
VYERISAAEEGASSLSDCFSWFWEVNIVLLGRVLVGEKIDAMELAISATPSPFVSKFIS